METSRLKAIGVFLARYATYLLGSGVHTSRTVRNTKRMAEALGVEAHITTLMRTTYQSSPFDLPSIPISVP